MYDEMLEEYYAATGRKQYPSKRATEPHDGDKVSLIPPVSGG